VLEHDDSEPQDMTRRSDTPATDAMKGDGDAFPGRVGSGESDQYAGIERRINPHRDDERADWETIALRRIARRVELMPAAGATSSSASVDHGWEEAAVSALRRRLGELKSG